MPEKSDENFIKPVYIPVEFKFVTGGKTQLLKLFLVNKGDITPVKSVTFNVLKQLYLQEYQTLSSTSERLKQSETELSTEIDTLKKSKQWTQVEKKTLEKLQRQWLEHAALLKQINQILFEAKQQFPLETMLDGAIHLKSTPALTALESQVSTDDLDKKLSQKKPSAKGSNVRLATHAICGLRTLCSVLHRVDAVINEYLLVNDKTEINHLSATDHLRNMAIEAQSLRGAGTPWLKRVGIASLILTSVLLVVGGVLALPLSGGVSMLPAVVAWAQLGAISGLVSSLTSLSISSVGVAAITLSMVPVATGAVGLCGFFVGRHTGQAAVVHRFASMPIDKPVRNTQDWFNQGGSKAAKPAPAEKPIPKSTPKKSPTPASTAPTGKKTVFEELLKENPELWGIHEGVYTKSR